LCEFAQTKRLEFWFFPGCTSFLTEKIPYQEKIFNSHKKEKNGIGMIKYIQWNNLAAKFLYD
jgi:hypothetical protein